MLRVALTDPSRLLGTLLNRLFGTTFDVMDETRRQQTTKGTLPFTHPTEDVTNRWPNRNLDVQGQGYGCNGYGRGGYGWTGTWRGPGK